MSAKSSDAIAIQSINQAIEYFFIHLQDGNEPFAWQTLETYLVSAGEEAIEEFISHVESRSGLTAGPWWLPEINANAVARPGLSLAENGEAYEIPSTIEAYQQERLRLMAKVAVQRALQRKIVVNVGIGFIGTANITAAACAMDDRDLPAYLVIGYQRPSSHSSWKVNFMNRGLPTITTADNSLAEGIRQAYEQGNLTATFLQEQSLAVADMIFVETELHVRKYTPRAIERAEADPKATLSLLAQIASVMQPDALLVIESTVYPGFTRHDALPLINQTLQLRGVLASSANANLAYGFHRVKPGTDFMSSFYSIPRDAGGITAEATARLQAFYETTGIQYQMHADITASELMKDIENASKFGLLDLMSAFMKSAEVTGINGFEVIRSIARARPEEHGRYIEEVAGLQVGGYCVPKELGLLINGLRRHYAVSELGIRQIFYSRIASASISDYRAEDAVYHILQALGEQGVAISDSQLYWAGISYKENVGDTRMAGTERGVRYAAHLGAANRVTDPLVLNWPELQQQRLGDPECWGHGLENQEGLRDIRIVTSEKLEDDLSPADDVIILAVRHPAYVGAGKPEHERMNHEGYVYRGIDAVSLTALMLGQPGKVILDTFDFLSDNDIREFLALGWKVKAFGKGHISRLAEQINDNERDQLRQAVVHNMLALAANGGTAHASAGQLRKAADKLQANLSTPTVEITDKLIRKINEQVIQQPQRALFSRLRQTGELLIALADNEASLKPAGNIRQLIEQLQSLRYLNQAGLEGLNQDLDRLAYEMMNSGASLSIAKRLRELKSRPELAISDTPVKHALFKQDEAPHARLLPATVFVTDKDNCLQKLEDPQGLPYRLSTKWVPDLAGLLADKPGFPVQWSKFSVEVPIYLRKVSDNAVEYDLYEDFSYLPLELRDWLVNEVWDKGYVLTTLSGEPQQMISYLMDVNLDPKTVARGRGGILFWQDTRQPVLLTTPEGHEIPLELKAIGDYRGGSADNLNVNYNRTIISGRVEGGGTAKTNLGQVAGHMFSADDIKWQERLKSNGPYLQGKTPRSIFRVRWSYPEKPNEAFQMVGRGSPSSLRLGHVFAGTDSHDVSARETAYMLGWNNAEVLGHDISAVHIALNLDNVMSNGYYTDTGSNIDLFCERDPRGSFRDYAGYGLLMVLYTYAQMKAFQEKQTALPPAHTEFMQPWFNGFLDRFLQIDSGRKVANREFFTCFYDISPKLYGSSMPAEKVIDEWLDTLWQHYVPYHVLRNRLCRGYNPDMESAFTTGRDSRMFDATDPDKARAFLENQLEVITLAESIGMELGRPLAFDFESALQEINEKHALLEQRLKDNNMQLQDIYQLGFYKSLEEDVYTVLDHEDQNRLIIARARPTIFIDKMDANINQRMRLSGLRVIKMQEKANSAEIADVVRAYVDIWKGPESHAPGEYDIQSQSTANDLLKLIQKDFHMASMLNQKELEPYKSLHWQAITQHTSGVMTAYQQPEQAQINLLLSEKGKLEIS